jgi:hypothetical protein
MLRAGTITQEMHDAGKDFQAAFIVANLDPLRAIPILRAPGTGREPELNERHDSESIAALREALDCGVNFIDTELTPKWAGHTLRG